MELPIDMFKDFPVGDCLHLLDFGITKRLLIGWKDGNLGNADAKWSSYESNIISKFLASIKAPAEIRAQRPIRDFESFKHWKAIEFRNFGLYVGIVVLKSNMPDYIYSHFILYFCAITIFSSEFHLKSLMIVGEKCIDIFLDRFKMIYGKDYFSSNLHNLSHLADDVKRFGALNTFSTYPFEGKLFKISRLLRSGNLPLAQAAKRILEEESIPQNDNDNTEKNDPFVKKLRLNQNLELINSKIEKKYQLFSQIHFSKFIMDCDRDEDRWFLTKENEIVKALHAVVLDDGKCFIHGQSLKTVYNLFELPIPSSTLLIHCSKCIEVNSPLLYSLDFVKCKLFVIRRNEAFIMRHDADKNDFVFLPLLSTF